MNRPQWSPVMKTGNTSRPAPSPRKGRQPQWSPVMKTGNTRWRCHPRAPQAGPQWSPVMKTGNTWKGKRMDLIPLLASMEPGHEDREYGITADTGRRRDPSLNGARS